MSLQMESEIAELETRAEELRSKFFSTVDALDARGELTVGAAARVRRSAPIVVAAGLVVLALVGGAALWAAAGAARAALARRGRRRSWARLLAPLRGRIVVVAQPAERRRSVLGELARDAAKVAARASLVEVTERLAPIAVSRVVRRLGRG